MMTRSILHSGKSNEFSKWHKAKYIHIVLKYMNSSLYIKPFQIYPQKLAACQNSDYSVVQWVEYSQVSAQFYAQTLFTVFLWIALKCEQSSCCMLQSSFHMNPLFYFQYNSESFSKQKHLYITIKIYYEKITSFKNSSSLVVINILFSSKHNENVVKVNQ